MDLTSVLPPLYSRWMSDALRHPIPEERKATCSNCAMCSGDPASEEGVVHFSPDTKCCTYNPDIPNFLAGAILKDSNPDSAEGKTRFLSRFGRTAILRPQGVCPSLAESASHTVLNDGFGSDPSMLCPHYIQEGGGLCGIWEHRNARCATFFCKHERGAVGRNFWRSLKELLAGVEESLSLWCIHSLRAGTEAFRELFQPGDPDLARFQEQQELLYRSALPGKYISESEAMELKQQMWGDWLGREAAFYVECNSAVTRMTWGDVIAVGGQKVLNYANCVQELFADLLDAHIPPALKPAQYRAIPLRGGEIMRVWGYSQYDPIDLPAFVLQAIPYFDGSPTHMVLERINDRKEIALTPELVQILFDFGILQES